MDYNEKFYMVKKLLILTLYFLSFSTFAKTAFIQVNADTKVEALPDYIKISVSIEKQAKSSAQAKAKTDTVSEALNVLLNNENIKEQDIDQARINIYPNYLWDKGKRLLQGYKASRSVLIKLRDLDSYNQFIKNLSQLDLQRVSSDSGGFDNTSLLEEEALVKALGKAKAKAAVMAKALGSKLGEVLMIQEGRASVIQPRLYSEVAVDSENQKHAINGELNMKPQTVSASVTVQFELK